jgi:general stress protein 26
MAVQKVDDRGSLWFLSASDSHQNKDILADANVQLMFQGSQHSDFLTLYGRASISTDRAKIKEPPFGPFGIALRRRGDLLV